MSGIPQVTKTGPRTYGPADGVSVLGGQVVEARAGGRIGPAAAASTKVLGVALADSIAAADQVTGPTTVAGRLVVNSAILPSNVAVAYGGVEVRCTYAAAASFGDLLIAAANGQVTPAGATPAVGTVIGRCTEPAGVAANGVGLVRITV